MSATESNATELVRKVPTYEECKAKIRPDSHARLLQAQAMAYVWGFQDGADKGAKDTGYSIDFGRAYGVYAAEYAAGERHCLHNIADAFTAWNTTGDVAADRPF
jgi:hypothetical protein